MRSSAAAKRKLLSLSGSSPVHPAHSLVTTLTCVSELTLRYGENENAFYMKVYL
jgi:hypothetical protein